MNEQLIVEAFRAALEGIVREFSQAEVARATGVPESTLSRIRSGEHDPKLSTVVKILNASPELGRVFAPPPRRDAQP